MPKHAHSGRGALSTTGRVAVYSTGATFGRCGASCSVALGPLFNWFFFGAVSLWAGTSLHVRLVSTNRHKSNCSAPYLPYRGLEASSTWLGGRRNWVGGAASPGPVTGLRASPRAPSRNPWRRVAWKCVLCPSMHPHDSAQPPVSQRNGGTSTSPVAPPGIA